MLSLHRAAAEDVLLVQAVEETDRQGVLLPVADRRAATLEARERHPPKKDDGAWLAHRAATLRQRLTTDFAFLPSFLAWSDPGRGLLGPTVVLATLLGLATNVLGPARQVNVLALPLLGLIAWNLVMLLLLTLRRWLPLPLAAKWPRPRLLAFLERQAERAVARLPERQGSRDGERVRLLRTALPHFLEGWLPAVAPLAAARIRRLLHAGALALVAGAVAGMYLRGIGFAYQATWESTFLSASVVERLLQTVLAPAAALLGTEVPSVSAIESPRSATAAPWIHLYAVLAAITVGVPRLLLVGIESWRVFRRSRRVAVYLPETYRRRLVAAVSTLSDRIAIVPYSYQPTAKAITCLKGLLLDLFGPRAEVRSGDGLAYGADVTPLTLAGERCRLLLFNLSQTPEVEVHGEVVAVLREHLADGQSLAVVVDGSTYRRRVAVDRVRERQRAWDRVVGDSGLRAVHLDLEEPDDDTMLASLVAGLWPPEAANLAATPASPRASAKA